MFNALSAAGINVHMITTSEIKISVLVDRLNAQKSVEAAHKAFGLDGFFDDSLDYGVFICSRSQTHLRW